MNNLILTYCINAEHLYGYTVDDKKIEDLAISESGIWFEAENDFRVWNGGVGSRSGGLAYLSMPGYGLVKNMDDARKAVGILAEKEMEWPSHDEIAHALAVVEQVRECYA